MVNELSIKRTLEARHRSIQDGAPQPTICASDERHWNVEMLALSRVTSVEQGATERQKS